MKLNVKDINRFTQTDGLIYPAPYDLWGLFFLLCLC